MTANLPALLRRAASVTSVALVISLVACGGSESPANSGASSTSTSSATSGAESGNSENIQGGLTANQIRHVIQENIGDIQRCYEQGLVRDPTLEGRVSVSFVIGPNGAVVGSSFVDDSLGDSTAAECMAAAVRTWTFPRPDPSGPVSVRFPFNLRQSPAR